MCKEIMNNQNSKAFDFVEHEKKIDKLITQSFSASFSSNAKWRKCFTLLNDVASDMQVIWKFVGAQNDGVRYGLPSVESLEEGMLSSRFWHGPMYYKEIEWIEFPKIGKPYGQENIPGAHYKQDVDAVLDALNEIGQWQIETTELGFRLYGHQ
jgi:hypothetical protein